MSIKLLLGLIAIVASLGFSYVYAFAEETPDTVIIPFEPNSRICGYTESGNWACEWDPTIIDLQKALTNNTSTIHEPVEAQTKVEEIIEEEPVTVTEIPKELTKFEKDLVKFEDNPPRSASDKEYYELLKNLAQCQRGYAESRGIQTNEWYDISYTWVNDGEAWLKSLDYKGRHAELKMAIEECIAQRTILNPVILGAEYYNKGQYFGKIQPSHQEMATITTEESKWIASFAVYDKLRDKDIEFEKRFAKDSMCSMSTSFKLDYCKNPVYVNVGGSVSIQNDIEDRYNQYLQDGGKAQSKEIREQILNEQMKKLRETTGGQK